MIAIVIVGVLCIGIVLGYCIGYVYGIRHEREL